MKNSNNNEHLKQNPKLRKKLRTLGKILTTIGGIFIVVGTIDFFTADLFEGPKLFWMSFLGIIILFPGLVCLSYGYMGSVARYTASEVAPVKKDTINYMLDGTKDEIARTIKTVRGNVLTCTNCGEDLDIDSSFCNHCGYKIKKECNNCNTVNDSDSKYCKTCGKELG